MGASPSKKCPTTGDKPPGTTHVTFRPAVLDTNSKANADVAVAYKEVCGHDGLLRLKGKKGAANQEHVCMSAYDLTHGLGECLLDGADSAVGRVSIPEGVTAKVYDSWDCGGAAETTLTAYADQTFPLTGKKQSLHFTLLPSYACDSSGNVVSTVHGTTALASVESLASEAASKSQHRLLIYALVGVGILIVAVLMMPRKKSAKDMNVDEIMSSVGLRVRGR